LKIPLLSANQLVDLHLEGCRKDKRMGY